MGQGEDGRYIPQHSLSFTGVGMAYGRCQTGVQMMVQQKEADLSKGRLYRLNLLHHIEAGGISLHHPLNAFHMAGCARQPLPDCCSYRFVHFFYPSPLGGGM